MKNNKVILTFMMILSLTSSQCVVNEDNRCVFYSELSNYILNTDCMSKEQFPKIQFGYKGTEIESIQIQNFPCDTFNFDFSKFQHLNLISIDGESLSYFVPSTKKGIQSIEFTHTNLFPNLPDLRDFNDLNTFIYTYNYSENWGKYDTCLINNLPNRINQIIISNCSYNYIIIDTIYKSISYLDISNLNLNILDSSIYKLKSLKHLRLEGNDSLKEVHFQLFPTLEFIKLPKGYLLNKQDSNYLISMNIICNLLADSCYENNY